MRRRTRIDLGQETNSKEDLRLDRKRKRWAAVNKEKSEYENPFLFSIKPSQKQYGEVDESAEELQTRLDNLEFGNFPGYFNYRNKAAAASIALESKKPHDLESQNKETNDDYDDSEQMDHRKRNADGETNKAKSKQQQQPVRELETDGNNAGAQRQQTLDFGLSDERLGSLKPEWFKGKKVLDVGCNRGHITYAIARAFSPKFIVGIDIDSKMIIMANKGVHLHLEEGLMKKSLDLKRKKIAELQLMKDGSTQDGRAIEDCANHFTLCSYITQGPLALSAGKKYEEQTAEVNEDCRFPNNLVFVEHNYVLATEELVGKQKSHFDTIVCLSVTKWIHLNYRDEGLKRFFKRMYNHLRPGGYLVLEAQPFENYKRSKKLSDRLKANYYSIQFKPEEFDDYLLGEEVGFRQVVQNTMTEHECRGFKRPLKVFVK